MDITIFWKELFSPLTNFISIFLATFIALLTERIHHELEEVGGLEVFHFSGRFWNKLWSWIIRFVLAFFFSLLLVFALIVIISLVLAFIGFFQNIY